MRIPRLRGTIDRRILVNYRIDADVMAAQLPPPFRPKLVGGQAIGGICLIRLAHVRPRWLPAYVGIGSENAAHRIAVQWDRDGKAFEGVYIPRRDTSSRLNAFAGGRVFPGAHHRARFRIAESHPHYEVSLASDDGQTQLAVHGQVSEAWPPSSVFPALEVASSFFESGALGYSATDDPSRFDGLELACRSWRVEALEIHDVASSYFDDPTRFPPGSAAFDCALLMRDIQHEWIGRDDLCCPSSGQ